MMAESYKYKFTIIMSIYDTEQWLEEAVDSILKQNIGFKENVQIIFVNDGSPDDSEEICLRYQSEYPDNIKYIKQSNKGLSGARNTGLKYREGKYINFFDPDDVLPKNTLREVWNFYANNQGLALVALPLVFFEAKEGIHGKYEYMGTKNRVIDLIEEPYNFVLSSASSFYDSSVFKNISYNTKLFGGEDTLVNFTLYKNNPRIGYVCERGVKYLYRQRDTANSIVNKLSFKPEAFTSTNVQFKELFKIYGTNNVPSYLQELIIYDLRARLRDIKREVFDKDTDFYQVVKEYRRYLQYVDNERILEKSPFITTNAQRYIFASRILSKKPRGLTKSGLIYFDEDRLPSNIQTNIFIKDISLVKDGVELDILFQDYNTPSLEMAIKDSNGAEILPVKTLRTESRYDVRYGQFEICDTIYHQYFLPYKDSTYHFYTRDAKSGKEFAIARPVLHRYSRYILNSKYLKFWHGDYAVQLYENNLAILHQKAHPYLNNLLTMLLILRRHGRLPLLRLFNSKDKKFILISDRPQVARDNGEALFEYINNKLPRVAKYTYFVLRKDSPDYKRVKKMGKVVKKNSIRHKIMYLNAKFVISSHLHPLFLNPFSPQIKRLYQDRFNSRLVWLQHGITKDDISSAANKFNELPSRTVVASPLEIKEFTQPRYFYDNAQLIKSGFPRYDKLYSDPENIITVMPTWRTFLSGKIQKNGKHEVRQDDFKDTQYYRAYTDLISNHDLLTALIDKGYRMQFVLHPALAEYADEFSNFGNELVSIIHADDVDYRKLFAQSKLLVTDYSSVYFDFAYLGKPVLFYQFDQEEFFSRHYKKGTFSYERDAPGPIFTSEDGIVSAIVQSVSMDCVMDDKYSARARKLFLYHDKNNSKRVYEAILDMDRP